MIDRLLVILMLAVIVMVIAASAFVIVTIPASRIEPSSPYVASAPTIPGTPQPQPSGRQSTATTVPIVRPTTPPRPTLPTYYTPYPTYTVLPKPTGTPKLTATPQLTLSPSDTVRVAIETVLGSSNRQGVKRISKFELPTGRDAQVFVEWAINDSLTAGLRNSGARRDITRMLEAIATSGVNYGSIFLRGTFSMVDSFGNAEEGPVLIAFYERATVERINWDHFLSDRVYDIADNASVHQDFQK